MHVANNHQIVCKILKYPRMPRPCFRMMDQSEACRVPGDTNQRGFMPCIIHHVVPIRVMPPGDFPRFDRFELLMKKVAVLEC